MLELFKKDKTTEIGLKLDDSCMTTITYNDSINVEKPEDQYITNATSGISNSETITINDPLSGYGAIPYSDTITTTAHTITTVPYSNWSSVYGDYIQSAISETKDEDTKYLEKTPSINLFDRFKTSEPLRDKHTYNDKTRIGCNFTYSMVRVYDYEKDKTKKYVQFFTPVFRKPDEALPEYQEFCDTHFVNKLSVVENGITFVLKTSMVLSSEEAERICGEFMVEED